MKDSHTISGNMLLENVLQKTMEMVMKHISMQRGVILLYNQGRWIPKAQGNHDDGKVSLLQPMDIHTLDSESNLVSIAIIKHVEKTKEPLALTDTSHQGLFTQDRYLLENQIKSVLCSPLMYQEDLKGILYLENHRSTEAFSKDCFEILQLFTSQMALSLENLELYTHLEQQTIKQAQQLKKAHEKIHLLEKQNTEHQIVGEFAHEVRNAIVGSKLITEQILGKDQNQFISLHLQNSRKLKELSLYLQEHTNQEVFHSSLAMIQLVLNNEEHVENALRIIYEAFTRSLFMTEQMIHFSKIGHMPEKVENVSIHTILINLVKEVEMETQENQIQISIELAENDFSLQGNSSHLYSIFHNLIRNAKEALLTSCSHNQTSPRIWITSLDEDQYFFVSVTDNGIGIPKEYLHQIYNAFFSTKPNTGTGLGLGYVKKILSLYQGKIEVESIEGKGTTFRISFPKAPQCEPFNHQDLSS